MTKQYTFKTTKKTQWLEEILDNKQGRERSSFIRDTLIKGLELTFKQPLPLKIPTGIDSKEIGKIEKAIEEDTGINPGLIQGPQGSTLHSASVIHSKQSVYPDIPKVIPAPKVSVKSSNTEEPVFEEIGSIEVSMDDLERKLDNMYGSQS